MISIAVVPIGRPIRPFHSPPMPAILPEGDLIAPTVRSLLGAYGCRRRRCVLGSHRPSDGNGGYRPPHGSIRADEGRLGEFYANRDRPDLEVMSEQGGGVSDDGDGVSSEPGGGVTPYSTIADSVSRARRVPSLISSRSSLALEELATDEEDEGRVSSLLLLLSMPWAR